MYIQYIIYTYTCTCILYTCIHTPTYNKDVTTQSQVLSAIIM